MSTGDDLPTARVVLEALADLAPAADQRQAPLTISTDWFRWLPLNALTLLDPTAGVAGHGIRAGEEIVPAPAAVTLERRFGERLAAIDLLRPEHRSLRVGWLFAAGRAELPDGRTRRWFAPLVEAPVRISRPPGFGRARIRPAGDVEITPLVTDDGRRHELEGAAEFGGGSLHSLDTEVIPEELLRRMVRLQAFAESAATAAGLPAGPLLPAREEPQRAARRRKPVIIAGVAIFSTHEEGGLGRASSLRSWAARELRPPTAFQSMYLPGPGPHNAAPPSSEMTVDEGRVVSPFVLTPAQTSALVASRSQPVSVLSGAPGTGKSHTLVAIAADALHRGESVLVAAKSDAAVDALLDLLERAPGVDPVVFGSSEKRMALAERMSAGQTAGVSDRVVEAAAERLSSAVALATSRRRTIAAKLAAEVALVSGRASEQIELAERWAPAAFRGAIEVDAAQVLLADAASPGTGWFGAWRQRRRIRKVATALAAPLDVSSLPAVDAALRAVPSARAARAIEAAGGLELGKAWDELLDAEAEQRAAMGELLRAESRSAHRVSAGALRTVGALATALRSGRGARRQQLERLDGAELYRVFPLWVGTLSDIDDLLPHVPGAFDLAIVDEASSVDQPLAAAALIRARRAVIAGDPRQLRHVSFLADARLREVAETYGLSRWPSLTAAIDVRRNSAFDVAAGVAPVQVLDEHFRSAPGLIEHIAREVYGGAVSIASRRPSTVDRSCVTVVRLDGDRDGSGAVDAEVRRVLRMLREMRGRGERDVGVISPFRSQADAIELAVLATFTADDIEALDLRVGTVHAFQGNERQHVIVSIGAGKSATAGTWRFVDESRLFVVMMTRAREHLTILLTGSPPEGGLLASYLAQAESEAAPRRAAGDPTAIGTWPGDVAEALRSVGIEAVAGYRTGRHTADVVLTDAADGADLALDGEVVGRDPDAHIERHLSMRRAGWQIRDAYASRWRDRLGELVIELKDQRW